MKNMVNVGIVGCGWIAENAHIPAFRKINNVKILSVFDLNIERCKNLANKYSISGIFDDYDKFLDSGVEAVVICTSNYTHAEFSIKALEKGIHVLCEKPVATCLKEILDIIHAAKRTGKFFVPGFVNRFREDIQGIHNRVLKGEIGKIKSIRAGWVRKSGMPRPGTWFTNKKQSGGGTLIDLGSHVIDICLMFLKGQNTQKVELYTSYDHDNVLNSSAQWFEANEKRDLPIDVESSALAIVEFSEGTNIEVELSWSKPVENDYTYFTLYGESGEIQLQTLFGFSNNRLWKEDRMVIKKDDTETEVFLDKETNNSRNAFDELAKYYIERVSGKTSDFLTEKDGFETVRLIEQLYASEKRLD